MTETGGTKPPGQGGLQQNRPPDQGVFQQDRAGGYDDRIRRSIPGYDAMHAMAAAHLQLALGPAAHVLVVGAGTGMELLTLGAGAPGWRFTAVEPSAPMLAVARRRLAEHPPAGAQLSERVELHEGILEDLPAGEPHDAATLILVLHFLPDDGAKAGLLGQLAARMRPGAPLILVDQHGERPSPAFAARLEVWKQHQRNAGIAPPEVEQDMARRMGELHYVTEARIVELLREAGFGGVERFYQALVFGGWCAVRE